MTIVVKKFGGTSVATIDNVKRVATIIERACAHGEQVVAVVSAMAGVTNQLLQWAEEVSPFIPYTYENDVVSCSGEQVTAGLLALTLNNMGLRARSWMGWQLPIQTTDCPGEAEILSINTHMLLQDLEQGVIPIVAGFQGMNEKGRLTTLGRGGSDTTAVALSSMLDASVCQIFTDVRGVYTADPMHVQNARRHHSISYKDMLSLVEHGTKVLHRKAVQWAYTHDVPIQVLSTFVDEDQGTWIQQQAGQVRSIAQKIILSWHIHTITPSDAHKLYETCQKAQILFLDWNVSAHGLNFLTTREMQKKLQSLLPAQHEKREMTLVTFIGPEQPILVKSGIPIVRYFRFPYATSIMIENCYAAQAVQQLHDILQLHEAG